MSVVDRIRVALLVGAGAVENAWVPVIRAVQPYCAARLTGQGVNFFFAQLVYQLRWFGALDTDLGRKETAKLREYLANIRQGISKELGDAQQCGEIRVREQFQNIVENVVLPNCHEVLLISTNWDLVVDEAIMDVPQMKFADGQWHIRTNHLHGSVKDPSALYLPTEVTREPYRTDNEDKTIGTIHGNIMDALENANRVVLYGLSLSPLDAELSMTVGAGWDNDQLREIYIIDPDYNVIAERVFLLLKRPREVLVRGCDPRDLTDVTVYE